MLLQAFEPAWRVSSPRTSTLCGAVDMRTNMVVTGTSDGFLDVFDGMMVSVLLRKLSVSAALVAQVVCCPHGHVVVCAGQAGCHP